MLLNISVVMVLVYTAVCIGYVQIHRKHLLNMTGNMVAMTTGLISNLTIGVILGMMFAGDLVLSTGLSVLFCFVIGYLVGKPLHLLAVIEGIGGGIMGGLHGAMLGEMIPRARWDVMLFIMDALFIAMTAMVMYLIHNQKYKAQETAGEEERAGGAGQVPGLMPIRLSFWMLYIILPVVTLCAAAIFSHSVPAGEVPVTGHEMHSM